MKKYISNLILSTALISSTVAKADFWDYFGSCMMAMGGGLAGAAFASSRLEDGGKMSTTGYGIAGGISCLTGMAFVGVMGAQSKFETEYRLKEENDRLMFRYTRLSKERCLLKETCEPGGRAIIVDTPTEIRKQGDKVFETVTSTIEVNE